MISQQIQQRYLNFPVKEGAPKRQVNVLIDGQLLHDFEIELAEDDPDFWVFLDLDGFLGKKAVVQIIPALEGELCLEPALQSAGIICGENVYKEALRPQIHFTARRGWLNDPNGLVFYDGLYHLFYQHNPYGVKWGNMHWGHAVSSDLLHWQEQEETLYPDSTGTMYSGSAVVDWGNTSGLQQGDHPPLVLIYTAAGNHSAWSKDQPFTQCLAASLDGGQTFRKYAANPVLPEVRAANRDPKVIWHAPTQRWVMALYLDETDFALFASPDLKQWQQIDSFSIAGCSECPDIFELPVDGNPEDTRWVLWGANASYLIGRFDGQRFTREAEVLDSQHGGSAYAAQTYSDIPAADGRIIQVAWLRGDISKMPFNQQMAFPVSLSLRSTEEGIRLYYQPVEEIERLYGRKHTVEPQPLHPGENPLAGLLPAPDAFELNLEIAPGSASQVGLSIRGVEVVYDAQQQTLACLGKKAPLKAQDGKIHLRLLADRASLEIFANQGQVYLPLFAQFPQTEPGLEIFARGSTAVIEALEVTELQSIWL
jgi:fructan beta-fructosidase